MQFVSPSEWGARVDYDTWSDSHFRKDDVAIHYNGPAVSDYTGGVEREKRYLRAIERYHIDNRGWRGVAYGYAIGASGTVYRLRGKNNYGAHQGDLDGDSISNNKEVVPILFILGEGQEPTEAMWDSCSELYWWLTNQVWTDGLLSVYGHRQIQPKATACPGDIIMAGIGEGKATQLPAPDPEPIDAPTMEQFRALRARVEKLEAFEAEVRAI